MPISTKSGDSLSSTLSHFKSILGWRVIRIKGHSMSPYLDDGDYVLGKVINKGEDLSPGEYIELIHPDYGSMVKSVLSVYDREITVTGKSITSMESDHIGKIPKENAVTRILWRISPQGITRL